MSTSKSSLSPRELALALGVSESSMKRWIDAGQVQAVRTSGGHRRVSKTEAIRFIRSRQLDIVDPSALGIHALGPEAASQEGLTAAALIEAFLSQDAARAERLIVAAYLRGAPLCELFDGPIRNAMDHIGGLWRNGMNGIMYEHRATDILVRTLSRLRSLQPKPPDDAPTAVGGGLSNDPYLLPSMMAAAVLAEEGFAATNLGPDTPSSALAEACHRLGGDLLWLSVSISADRKHLVEQLEAITAATAPRPLALGGRGVEGCALPEMDTVYPLASMEALAGLAREVAVQVAA